MPHIKNLSHSQCCFLATADALSYFPWAKVEALRRIGDRMEEARLSGYSPWSLQYRQTVFLQVFGYLLGVRPFDRPEILDEENLSAWFSSRLSKPGSEHQIPASAYQAFVMLSARSLRGRGQD